MKLKFIKVLWSFFIIAWLSIFALFIAIYNGWIGYMPPIEELQNPIDKYASQVISSDGKLMGAFASSGANRVYVDYSDISPRVIEGLIATEDKRFEEHSGIDFMSLPRVIIKTAILRQKNAGGGSTITQQLAKQLYSSPTKGLWQRLMQKPIEWAIAVKLERFYTKEEIISMYLNQFDFLYNAVGIKSASRTYFDKEPKDLNIEESALLVGMCKNPSYYNPILHKKTNRPIERRNVVISLMEQEGYISAEEKELAISSPIKTNFVKLSHDTGIAPYFREYIRRTMMADKPDPNDYKSWQRQQYIDDSIAWEDDPLYGWCNKNQKADGSKYNIYNDGLKIHVSINAEMQKYAEESVTSHMRDVLQPAFDKENKGSKTYPFAYNTDAKTIESSINKAIRQSDRWRQAKSDDISDDEILKSFNQKTSMQIWTWKGVVDTIMTPLDSIKYNKSLLRTGFMAMNPHNGNVLAYVGGIDFSNFKYDMVSYGRRQIGSVIKPMLYSLSMIEGMSPCDEMLHVPQTIITESGQEWTPRNANQRRVGEYVSLTWGLQNSDNWVTAYLMDKTSPYTFMNLLRSFGLNGSIVPTPSMSLGTPDASVKEMATAYTTFVKRGQKTKPVFVTRITDNMGNIIANFNTITTEVLPEDASYKMNYMMQQVVNGGTASRLRNRYQLTMPLGGKTGTTQSNSDAWFVGFTPDIVAAVWVGGDEPNIHFRSMAMGQGASAALPIFGNFIKKIYENTNLGYSNNSTFGLPEGFNPCYNAQGDSALDFTSGSSSNDDYNSEIDDSSFM